MSAPALVVVIVALAAAVAAAAFVWRRRTPQMPPGPALLIGATREPLRAARGLGRADWRGVAGLPEDLVDDHAAVVPAADGAWEAQLRRGRHMYVNGWRSRHNRLHAGDEIALGASGAAIVRFVDGAARGTRARVPPAPATAPPRSAELLPIGEVISDANAGQGYVITALRSRAGACQTYEAASLDGAARALLHEGLTPQAVRGAFQLSLRAAATSPRHLAQLMPAFGVPWFDGAMRHIVPEVVAPDQLSEADLREQAKVVWEAWALELAHGLKELHAAGVALGMTEADLPRHLAVVRDPGAIGVARWHNLGNVVLLETRPEAEFDDVRAFAGAMARTKLIEAPSHVRQALLAASHPDARISAAALLARMGGGASARDGQVAHGPHEHRVEVGQATSRGMLRDNNEDSVCALTLGSSALSDGSQPVLIAVADGMGGEEAGEVASALAIEKLTQSASALFVASRDEPSREEIASWVQLAVADINAAVVAAAAEHGNQMGSTLVFALVVRDTAYLGNVGDSRIYRWRAGGELERLVKDHSLVQSLIDAGALTDEERYVHPARSLVLRSLGDAKTGVSDENAPLALQPGDWLLVCSDGLWEMMRDDAMRDMLAGAPNAQVACDRLVDLANANGGEDNISVAIARYL